MLVAYSNEAVQSLDRIATSAFRRIVVKVNQYAADPATLANMVRQLKGSRFLRLRVGDYRVIFTVEGGTMNVLQIGHRRDIYR